MDIVDLSGNMMQQISSTQKEKGGKKKQKQKLRDIDPLSCFPHAGIVVKNKKKIPEEARALGLVGTDTTTSLTGRSILRGTQDFYGKKFHVVTYFEGFFFFAVLLIKNLDQLLGISRLEFLLTKP